jgi:hypothetical protein
LYWTTVTPDIIDLSIDALAFLDEEAPVRIGAPGIVAICAAFISRQSIVENLFYYVGRITSLLVSSKELLGHQPMLQPVLL